MAHAQNSPRGLFAKNSTIIINGATLRVNSSGHFVVSAVSEIPTVDSGIAFALLSNSTGVAMAINSTGTTWKYFNLTSVQPT